MKKVISALLLGAMLTITACSSAPAGPQTKEVTVKGMADGLKVKVTATADKISAVEIVSHNETDGISDNALKNMPSKIVTANKITVDGESGATYTSDGIKKAVEQAIVEMGLDASKFK